MKQNMTVKKINLRQSIDLGNGKIAKAGSTLYIPMKEGRGDETAARELYLFINNDGDLHRQQTSSIIKTLGKKFKKGVYDRQLAVKLWMYLIATVPKSMKETTVLQVLKCLTRTPRFWPQKCSRKNGTMSFNLEISMSPNAR
jgi:hypothetical protein